MITFILKKKINKNRRKINYFIVLLFYFILIKYIFMCKFHGAFVNQMLKVIKLYQNI